MKKLRAVTLLLCSFVWAGILHAEQIKLQMTTPYPVMESGKKKTTFVKVSLTGFKMKETKRPPVNVAIVLDKSGSMSGDKMEKAKAAAINAVNRLKSEDIVSIIAYDNGVQVLIPSTKISDKQAIIQIIQNLSAEGGTALFAGVSKGASEVRKFLKKESVNRVILLSDGQANQGPSSPAELGELGISLIKEGISVSTIGLGKDYNEDLMVRLASKSDGNHMFAETPQQLVAAFDKEFGDVLSVVAQEVVVKITCDPGVRPVKVLGREAEIQGQEVLVMMNQLYSSQEKFIILEVEVPTGEDGTTRRIAGTSVSYSNMQTKVADRLSSNLSVRFSSDKGLVDESMDKKTMVSCISLEATERNGMAMKLRDQGKIAEAQQILLLNCNILHSKLLICPSPELKTQWSYNKNDLDNIVDNWAVQRKRMSEANRGFNYQQLNTGGYDNVQKEDPRQLNDNDIKSKYKK